MKKLSKEAIGVILGLTGAVLWGIFPLIVSSETKEVAPITFAGITTGIAALTSGIYLVAQRKTSELRNIKAFWYLIAITITVIIIPYTLFFLGASQTSGLNTSMLLLSEIIFTLVFTHFIGEKTTAFKLAGSIGVLVGAALIVYNGTFSLNTGDVLIILSTLTYPIGNYYGKKALNLVSPATILTVRFTLGSAFILIFANSVEPSVNPVEILQAKWPVILFTGIVLLGVSKVLWYESLKRLDITKAVALAMTFPFFSLIAIVLYFKEPITAFQLIGTTIMIIGVYITIIRKSTPISQTKYAPQAK